MSVADDVVALIRQRCPDIINVHTDIEWAVRQPLYGVRVTQRQTSGNVDPLTRTDRLYVDVSVRGAGNGEAGRTSASEIAKTIYKSFLLIFDSEINGTEYIRIWPDSAPFEVPSVDGTNYDYQFGIELYRFIEE